MKSVIMKKFSKGSSSKDEWRTSTGSFIKKPSKGWLHSNQALNDGVHFKVKYVGAVNILESLRMVAFDQRGSIVREAICKCCLESQMYNFKRSKITLTYSIIGGVILINSGENVTTTISTNSVKSINSSGRSILEHAVENISFCALGEERYKNFIGYISKDEEYDRACFVFECANSLGDNIILSIGQAFELKYKAFLQSHQKIQPVVGRFTDLLQEPPQKNICENHQNLVNNFDKTSQYILLDNDSEKNDNHYTDLKSNKSFDDPTLYLTLGTTCGIDCATIYDNPIASIGGNCIIFEQISHKVIDQIPNERNDSNDYDSLSESIVFYNNPLEKNADNDNPLEKNTDYDNPLEKNADYDYPSEKKSNCDILPNNERYQESSSSVEGDNSDECQHLYFVSEQENEMIPEPMKETIIHDQCSEIFFRPNPTLSISVKPESWYHGVLTRDEAKSLVQKNGQFLVRESPTKKGQYVLTGMRDGILRHILLVDPKGKVRTREYVFNTVAELIKFHVDNNIPISSGSNSLFLINEVPFS